ncbi:DUF3659 domain-containing protein [Dyadobacter flavalbus]|uniref:DUF3659 domain-containing protein n=1 Tax=Dyadobacter flavalbus TaxID=2579942 RepID=A0A5M8R071_9BACT|nr:DUF3659 domain-containing protein [Dyadobacter flavalbus]KAA6439652.1 DUF3659 domain-containing protein [Dyadobacter flavalbus]
MKKNQFIFLLAFLFFAIGNVYSQNYKQPIPSIDAQGKVTDAKGKHIGWVTSDGIIKDAAGVKIAHIDDKGNAVDATGKNLGKASKNGTYLYHVKSGASDSLTVSVPMNGICEVKDKNGKTVLLLHENYKQYGACAMHCLQMKSEHKDMKMK